MDILQGLLPLLFASINFFLLINLIIFGRKTGHSLSLVLFLSSLIISQLCEFLICFFLFEGQFWYLLTVTGVWIAPIFSVVFIMKLSGLSRLCNVFYLLGLMFIVTLVLNYGDFAGACSLFALKLEYPSQWLWYYLSFAILILATIRLNFTFRNITDKSEIKKRRMILYSSIITLILTLIFVLAVDEGKYYLESIFAKTFIFMSLGMTYYVIRTKYKLQGN